MTGGVNLIGFLSANMGLGVAARNTAALLRDKGVPVTGLDIQAGMGRTLAGDPIREICVPTGDGLSHGLNLWHLNPPEIANLMGSGRLRIGWNRFNACVPFWELTDLPTDWFEALDAMDLILAPSHFIANTLATRLDSARISHYPLPLSLPEPADWDRQSLGISPDALVFVTSFDFGSSLERKNPLGVLQAFLGEFGDNPDILLLVKANNIRMNPTSEKLADLLRNRFAVHGNIRFLDQTMNYAEILALYRCADVFVSLHRAEGLGLGMMESMSLGKAVIGTGWSGNMEFMRDSNSCLVRHRLVPVGAESTYGRMMKGREAVWAEPDLEDAGRWMRRLAADPDLRKRLGERAAADIRRYNEEALKGSALDALFHRKLRWAGFPASRRREPKWTLPVAEPA